MHGRRGHSRRVARQCQLSDKVEEGYNIRPADAVGKEFFRRAQDNVVEVAFAELGQDGVDIARAAAVGKASERVESVPEKGRHFPLGVAGSLERVELFLEQVVEHIPEDVISPESRHDCKKASEKAPYKRFPANGEEELLESLGRPANGEEELE